MHVLITGGAGFIGSHLAEALLQQGHNVMVLDDLSTGSIANIRHLKREKRFGYVIDTVMNRALLAELVDGCDMVYHLAAAVGVRLVVDSPVRTLDTNIQATEMVLEAAKKKKKKVLITSTSEVYGKATKIPFHEDDDLVIGPSVCGRWSYACSKAIDEFLAIAYHREHGLPVVLVRLFNTVGPRQTGMYGMVLPRFVGQALSGSPITIYGDGSQSRCFGWVGDVVNALIRLSVQEEAVGTIFNIGSDEEVTINQLAAVVKEVTGSGSAIHHVSYEEAYGRGFEDMYRRVPDLNRIRAAIGYAPTKSLREIVEA
ncbi:MAG TPA: GDP-mannose 4,6-dehydratase, partial [Candidatus Binatia bacterium]|nr:GDP-mannose 4,6-dehydratase [Candidatus Binatia bacterium]